jgi:hypothetical protein
MGNLEMNTTYHIHQGDHQDNLQQGGTLLEIERCSVQAMKESFMKDGYINRDAPDIQAGDDLKYISRKYISLPGSKIQQ